jgi:hypothetical protein
MEAHESIYLSIYLGWPHDGGVERMKLQLTSRGIELTADLRDYVQRQVRFALGRFAGRIKTLSVQLSDVNGPRGGVDKCCDIRVDARFRQSLVVRERQASIHATGCSAFRL